METLHLFPLLDQHLITVLDSLGEGDWDKPTIAKAWTVKDIAAHLLDVTMRDISVYRDGYLAPAPHKIESYDDLVHYLNRLNAVWVEAFRRVSPRQIIAMIKTANEEQYQQLLKLDPDSPAIYAVGWAGEESSSNRFHIARLYTEKFHHQLQIRDALGKADALMTRELFHPFIATLLKGLPHTYRTTMTDTGTAVEVNILSAIGGSWHIIHVNGKWVLHDGPASSPAATITLHPETAWKLFTKGIDRELAMKDTVIYGEPELATPVLELVAVMASREK